LCTSGPTQPHASVGWVRLATTPKAIHWGGQEGRGARRRAALARPARACAVHQAVVERTVEQPKAAHACTCVRGACAPACFCLSASRTRAHVGAAASSRTERERASVPRCGGRCNMPRCPLATPRLPHTTPACVGSDGTGWPWFGAAAASGRDSHLHTLGRCDRAAAYPRWPRSLQNMPLRARSGTPSSPTVGPSASTYARARVQSSSESMRTSADLSRTAPPSIRRRAAGGCGGVVSAGCAPSSAMADGRGRRSSDGPPARTASSLHAK
jgi:hypothetical protein